MYELYEGFGGLGVRVRGFRVSGFMKVYEGLGGLGSRLNEGLKTVNIPELSSVCVSVWGFTG